MAKIGHFTVPDYAEFPGPGLAYYQNTKNGFCILLCHDSADPAKRSPEWTQAVRRGYTDARTFDQEHNLSFASWAGKPVFACFDALRHVAAGRLQYQPRILMQRWWDIGIHACVWAQVRDGQLFIYDSRQTIGAFGPKEMKYRDWEIDASGLGVFIERCIGISEQTYGEALAWKDIVDPSAFATDAKHETTAARIFQDHGLRPIAGDTQDIVTRINDIEDWMTFQPGMMIDPNAKIVVDALAGGFTFLKDGTSEKPNWQSGFGHCVVGDTLIDIPGVRVPIAFLEVGDFVCTPKGPRRVLATIQHRAANLIEVICRTGQRITTTPDHPFILPNGGRVRADTLRAGDTLSSRQSGVLLSISSIQLAMGEHAVYDLTVEEEHVFYANGILVGNCMASLSYGTGRNRAFHTRRQKDTIITSDLDPARHDLELRPHHRRRSGHWLGY